MGDAGSRKGFTAEVRSKRTEKRLDWLERKKRKKDLWTKAVMS